MLPYQQVPAVGYLVRAATYEVAWQASALAPATIGLALTRNRVGECAPGANLIWCDPPPTFLEQAQFCAVGAACLSAPMALAAALVPPGRHPNAVAGLHAASGIAGLFTSGGACALGTYMLTSEHAAGDSAYSCYIGAIAMVYGSGAIAVLLGGAVGLYRLIDSHGAAALQTTRRVLGDACCGVAEPDEEYVEFGVRSRTSDAELERPLPMQTAADGHSYHALAGDEPRTPSVDGASPLQSPSPQTTRV